MSDIKHTHLYSPGGCPTENALFDYIDKKLSNPERHDIEKHLLDCEMCTDALEGLELLKDRNKLIAVKQEIMSGNTTGNSGENNLMRRLAIAASLLILFGSVFFFRNNIKDKTVVADKLEKPLMDEPAPPPAVETEVPAPTAPAEQPVLKEKNKETAATARDEKAKTKNKKIPQTKAKEGSDFSSVTRNESSDAVAPEPAEEKSLALKKDDAVSGVASTPAPAANSAANYQNNNAAAGKAFDGEEQEARKKVISRPVAKTEETKMKQAFNSDKAAAPAVMQKESVPEMDIPSEPTGIAESDDKNTSAIFVDEMPQFPGGNAEMIKFIRQNLKYPAKAKEKGIEGTVFLNFVVNTDGSITKIRVSNVLKTAPELEKEAIRVVHLMPLWTPGKQKGNPVKVLYNLPVRFSLK